MIDLAHSLTTVSWSTWDEPQTLSGSTIIVSIGHTENRTPPVLGFFPKPAAIVPPPKTKKKGKA
jgi:hypothetical protein